MASPVERYRFFPASREPYSTAPQNCQNKGGTPAPHEPGTNRMNVAAGLAANGDLVVLASGWSHRPRRGAGRAGHDPPAHPLLPWVCCSGDGGRTWTQTGAIQPPDGGHAIPFGDIVRLPDGALGACIYSYRLPEHRACSFYTSADDGRTWAVRGVIRAHNISETTPLVLPNGELLACGRTRGVQHLELFRSRDGGATGALNRPSRRARSTPATCSTWSTGACC